MTETFQREIFIRPAFDKRAKDPKTDCGIGSVILFFILKGKKGAISIQIGTDAYLPETVAEYKAGKVVGPCGPIGRVDLREERTSVEGEKGPFRGWSIYSHRTKPASYQGKWDTHKCTWTKTGKCYGDGSCLQASERKLGELLLREGSDAIWKVAEEYYKSWIEEDR